MPESVQPERLPLNSGASAQKIAAEMATIGAAARVILELCEDQGDMRTKLERIAYAAAVLKRQATDGLEKINSTEAIDHG